MQLLLLALASGAVACAPCGCARKASPALLARGMRQAPAAAPGALGDPVDPLATEAAANIKPAAPGLVGGSVVDVEMATTNPELIRLAMKDPAAFDAEIKKRIALVLSVPEGRFTVTLQTQLALLQAKSPDVEAVMWVVHIAPVPLPNVTANGTNASNATPAPVLVCPPCPCEDLGPAPLVLPANSTAVLPVPREPSSIALGAELLMMVETPKSILQAVLPMTTARVAGGLFPAPEPTSVSIGSRHRGPSPAEQAEEINEGTQRLVSALRTQIGKANEARAEILTGSSLKPPEFDGKLPLPAADTDPWSSMKDTSALGRSAS